MNMRADHALSSHLYDCRGLSLQRIITLIDRRWESPVLSQFGFSMRKSLPV